MISDLLESNGAHGSIPPDQRLFDRLVGHWDLQVCWYSDGVVTRRERGEWSFGYVLEGRGIQDVWVVPARDQRVGEADLYEYGTSVRYYVPELAAWRSTWIGPMHDTVRTLIARRDGDDIVLKTPGHMEGALRWLFNQICPRAFKWQNFIYQDGEWLLQQDFECGRRK